MGRAATFSRREFLAATLASPMLTAFPRRERTRVVVVGAGAFGGWSALALRRAGLPATLIDAWGAGHTRASSGGETRVIRASYGGVAVYSEMAARALSLWRDAEQRWRRQVLFPTGALWLCEMNDTYVRASIPAMHAVGLSIEELSPREAALRYPQMRFDDARTVFYEPAAGFLAARVACELVRKEFVRTGGTYQQAWVLPGQTDGSRLSTVRLSTGTSLAADHFVFACGPWMERVFPEVIGPRIRATRQEVFFFGTPPGDRRFDPDALPVWVHLGERLTYGVPNHDGRGIKIADDTRGIEVDPTNMDRTPSTTALADARGFLRQRFPLLANAPLLDARVCQYEVSSDGHFLIDRHPQLENVWLVGGGSGHGFKMGPALGEHVANLVLGRDAVNSQFSYARLRISGEIDRP